MTDFLFVSVDDVSAAKEAAKSLILDVLPSEHYAARHIPTARNACVYEVSFLAQVAAIAADKNQSIIVYGAGEGSLDALTAAEKLVRDEYTKIRIFSGGLPDWKRAGNSLEGTQPEIVEPAHPVLELRKDTYRFIPEESSLFWRGRNYNGGHSGRLAIQDGELNCSGQEISGSFVVDMHSLANIDLAGDDLQPVLEAHLKSDDFFFVTVYPTCTVTVTQMNPIPHAAATLPNYHVQAEVTLRGITKAMTFDAQLRPLGDGKIALLANFDMDRTQWGVIYGSARFFKYLGYHTVFDMISIDLRIVLE